jgi:hypothetical protein
MSRVFGPSLLSDISVGVSVSPGGMTNAGYGILLAAGQVMCHRIHTEWFNYGIGITTSVIGTGGPHVLMGIEPDTGAVTEATVLYNDNGQGSLTAFNVQKGGAHNAIWDAVSGESLSAVNVPIYIHHSVGENPDTVFSPTFESAHNFMNPKSVRWGCSTTFDRTVGFSGGIMTDVETLASAGTISMSNRSTVLITGSAAVHTLSNGAAGQRVRFIGDAGAAAAFTRGNSLAMSAATITLGQNDVIDFQCLAGGVSWTQSSYVDNGNFA